MGIEIQYGSYPAPHRPTIWQANYKTETGTVLFTTNKPWYEENIICVWHIRAKQTQTPQNEEKSKISPLNG